MSEEKTEGALKIRSGRNADCIDLGLSTNHSPKGEVGCTFTDPRSTLILWPSPLRRSLNLLITLGKNGKHFFKLFTQDLSYPLTFHIHYFFWAHLTNYLPKIVTCANERAANLGSRCELRFPLSSAF